jgi:folate-binding protein YgfZ
MQPAFYVIPDERGVIAISGEDRRTFLQGLVSNDVQRVSPERAVYAALLTPQGRFLHDFFIVEVGETLYLDCEAERREDLRRRLSLYRLRSKAALTDATQHFAVALLFGENVLARAGLSAEAGYGAALDGGIAYVDPRLPQLGARALLPRAGAVDAFMRLGLAHGTSEAYDRMRLSLGVPDGSRDLPIDKAILLENGFDELNGIDWQKGCYMGQELTARTRYRGLVRKRLLPVAIEGPPPPPGTPVMRGDTEVGVMRSSRDGLGLALLRLEELGTGILTAAGSRISPRQPDWMRMPETQ